MIQGERGHEGKVCAKYGTSGSLPPGFGARRLDPVDQAQAEGDVEVCHITFPSVSGAYPRREGSCALD